MRSSSFIFSSFLLLCTLVLCLLSSSSFVSAVLPRSPYALFCKKKVNEHDWRYIMLYQQRLMEHEEGRRLLEELRKCYHRDEDRVLTNRPRAHPHSGEIKTPANKETGAKETVHKNVIHFLIHHFMVEPDRQFLHTRSAAAFECVDEFERTAAGDVPAQAWQEWTDPAAHPEMIEAEKDAELPYNTEDHAHHQPHEKFESWNKLEMGQIHPEEYIS